MERSKVLKAARELRLLENPYSVDDIKSRYVGKGTEKKDLFSFLKFFIDLKRISRERKTLKEYQTIINDLKDYELYFNEKLSYEKIDDAFYYKYMEYLTLISSNSINTIAKKFSTFKTMLNAATKLGHNTNHAYQRFKVRTIHTDKVFLSKKELLQLYHTDFRDNYRLQKVKDVFCFGSFTGLRFSDIDALRKEHVKTRRRGSGEKYTVLDFNEMKTKKGLCVPLNKYALQLVNKYLDNLPLVPFIA